VEYQVKFVVLPVELFETLVDRMEDEFDLRAIREAEKEPLYDQKEAQEYIFMNPVERERRDLGWTKKDLSKRHPLTIMGHDRCCMPIAPSLGAYWHRTGNGGCVG